MARARIRNIEVDGDGYRWAVGMVDPAHVMLRVWPGGRGRAVALEVTVDFDDPWLNYGPIITAPPGRAAEVFALEPVSSGLVAAVVRQALAAGWQAGQPGTTRLRLTRDRQRLEPPPG